MSPVTLPGFSEEVLVALEFALPETTTDVDFVFVGVGDASDFPGPVELLTELLNDAQQQIREMQAEARRHVATLREESCRAASLAIQLGAADGAIWRINNDNDELARALRAAEVKEKDLEIRNGKLLMLIGQHLAERAGL